MNKKQPFNKYEPYESSNVVPIWCDHISALFLSTHYWHWLGHGQIVQNMDSQEQIAMRLFVWFTCGRCRILCPGSGRSGQHLKRAPKLCKENQMQINNVSLRIRNVSNLVFVFWFIEKPQFSPEKLWTT